MNLQITSIDFKKSKANVIKQTTIPLKQTTIPLKQTSYSISFKGEMSNDTFERTSQKSFFEKLNHQEVTGIREAVKNNQNHIGEGWTSDVYRYEDYAIKVLKNIPKDPSYADFLAKMPQEQRNSFLFGKLCEEYLALKYMEAAGIENSQKAVDLISDGAGMLVTTFVKGVEPSGKKQNLKKEHLIDMLKKLTKLEQAGFVHHDLQLNNFFIDGDKVKIIDVGSHQFLIANLPNFGEFIKNRTLEIQPQKVYILLKPRIIPKQYYCQSLIDNPHLMMISDVANFEQRGLSSYLSQIAIEDKKPQEALQYFKEYLKLKAEHYHRPMAKYLEELDIQEVAKQSGINVDEAQKRMADAIKYENLAASVLSKAPDEVAQAELQKMQMRVMIRDNKDQLSLKNFMDEFSENIDGLITNTKDETKKYLESTKKFIEVFTPHKNACDSIGDKLADNKNLFKVIYGKVIENTQEIPQKVEKSSAKGKIFAGLAVLALGVSSIYYLIKTNKEEPNKNNKVA